VQAYGVDVVYGSNLKDVEAAARSFETQIQLDRVNTAPALADGEPAISSVKNPLTER
jgi:hypothetical protein